MAQSNQNLQGTQIIAKLFGVSTRRIEQLTAEGVIAAEPGTRPRKYDLLPTIQRYIKYLSDKANGREKAEKDAELTTNKLDAETRLKNTKAEVAELELKELKGQLLRASDVEEVTSDHVIYIRSLLMALPGVLAVDCANLKKAPQVAERIKKEVYRILRQLADYEFDAEIYRQRVREREGWNEQHREETGEAET